MNEKILIAGLGKSGFAAAGLLAGEGDITAWDSEAESNFDQDKIAHLKELGIRCIFEQEPEGPFDKVVLSPGISPKLPLFVKLAEQGALLSGELEEAFEHCAGTFFAITGTNGKTTTTALTGEMVKAAKIPCEVVGNIGLPATERAPFADADTIMVTEVSSFQLETAYAFRPHVSACLNVTPDHLNRHGTFEEYRRVKGLVFANQMEGDYFIYNADDEHCVLLAGLCPCTAVPFSSTQQLPFGAFVRDGLMVIADEEEEIELIPAKDLHIPGKHNLENALAAAAVAYFGGIPVEAIVSALQNFQGIEHRIEFIREFEGVRYVNDSKGTNPDSTIKAVEATTTPILLIAGGYEKNSDFTELIQNFNGKVKYLLLIGVTAKRFAECAASCGFPKDKMIFCKDMEECIAQGRKLAVPGDTVLLSPASASWDMYKCFEERGDHFRSIVNALR